MWLSVEGCKRLMAVTLSLTAKYGDGGDDRKYKMTWLSWQREDCVCVWLGWAKRPARGRGWRDTQHWWTERWVVYNTGRCNGWSTVLQPPKDLRRLKDSWTNPDQQTDKPPYRQLGIQHAGSGGFASAVVCSGVCGPGESGGEGGEAVRSRVPEGRRLHLRRLPLEEIPQWVRHGWWEDFSFLFSKQQTLWSVIKLLFILFSWGLTL